MNYYKISKDLWSCTKRFDTLEEAQAFADSLGTGYTVELVGPYVPPTIAEKLSMDMQFCQELITTFVYDNREMGTTQAQNDALMVKFQSILSFAQVGAVLSIEAHLPNITTDEVFTQARKDKYTQMITNYLAQF
jgi:hypothetical protein